jgi:general stress protein YciG
VLTVTKQIRGFALMNPDRQRRVAGKGGRSAHAMGRAHEWTVEEAQNAGRKGGFAKHRRQKLQPVETTGSRQTDDDPSVSPISRSASDQIVATIQPPSESAADITLRR